MFFWQVVSAAPSAPELQLNLGTLAIEANESGLKPTEYLNLLKCAIKATSDLLKGTEMESIWTEYKSTLEESQNKFETCMNEKDEK